MWRAFEQHPIWECKYQGWESLRTKKSETWIQIQRYVEMMPFLLFGNPWGYRFQGRFWEQYPKHQRSRPMSRISLFVEKNIVWFSSPGRHKKSLSSAKRLNNLIPEIFKNKTWEQGGSRSPATTTSVFLDHLTKKFSFWPDWLVTIWKHNKC